MKNRVDPRFHICTQYEKTIDHLISRWSALVPHEYLIRHDRVAQISTEKYVNILAPNILKTGKNINQKPSQKHIMLLSYGIIAYKETEKSKQTRQT